MTNTNIMRLLGLTAILCMIPFAQNAFAATATITTSKIISGSQIEIVFDLPVDFADTDFSNLIIDGESRTVGVVTGTGTNTAIINFSGGLTPLTTASTGTIDIGLLDDEGSTNDFGGQAGQILSDGQSPNVVISSTSTDPTNDVPIPMTAQFSEPVVGFDDTDLVVANGVISNFVPVDADTYTFDVTAAGDGLVTVDIAGASAQDSAANDNIAATQFSITFDGTAPVEPGTPDLQAGSDTGFSSTDDITDDTTPTFDIACSDPLDTITLYEGVNPIGSDTCGNPITSSVLSDGSYSITATETDQAGNVSPPSLVALSITIDTAGSPTIDIIGDNPATIDYGTNYVDLGATAFDALDGNLTGSIITSGATIDTIVGGYGETSHIVSYDVTDSNGNTAHAERIVNVGGRIIHGDYCTGDCIPPTIGLDSTGRRMVSWPVIYHTSTVDFRQLAEYFHTPMNDFAVNVGDINTLQFVVYDNSGFDAIRQIGLSIGVPFSGTFNDGAAQLRWFAAPLGQTVGDNTSYIEETDKDNVFELKSFHTERVECDPHKTGNDNCMGVTIKYIFREAPKDTAVRLDIWDEKRNAFQHVLNEGVTVKGDSMNGPDVFTAMANDGRMYTLTTDNNFATDQNGDRWSLVDGFWAKDLKPVINMLDDAREMAKDQQEAIAKQLFDGSKLQKTIAPVKDFVPEHYGRLHDPEPNMIKAYIDYAKAKAGHS